MRFIPIKEDPASFADFYSRPEVRRGGGLCYRRQMLPCCLLAVALKPVRS